MKKSFILHNDSMCVLEDLTMEQRGELFYAIAKYQEGIEIELSPLVKIAFSPFKNQFNRDLEKYDEFCKQQQEKGKKGGRPKKNPAGKKETQKTQRVSEKPKKANNDKDSKKDSKKESKKKYGEYKNVLLTETENNKLKQKFYSKYDEVIQNFSEAIEMKGYKYKSHYLAILKWNKNIEVNEEDKLLDDAKQKAENEIIEKIKSGQIDVEKVKLNDPKFYNKIKDRL